MQIHKKWYNKNHDEAEFKQLKEIVCREFGLTWLKLLRRGRELDAFIFLAHKHLRFTAKFIAARLRKCHATILNACKRVRNLYTYFNEFALKLDGIKKILPVKKFAHISWK